MDDIPFLLLIVLTFLLLISIPFGFSFLIYRFIERKNYDKRLKFFALVPVLILVYFVYTGTYPNDAFYKADFKEVTGLEFPKNGRIHYKVASAPDTFGDYNSAFLVNVNTALFDSLPVHLKNRGFNECSQRQDTDEINKVLGHIGDRKIERGFCFQVIGKYFSVSFLSDKETLVVQRISW